ncbi:MAG: HEAT repeat domain-containing protein [Deltaproteobacteria bacterium]|nr:HEAT repeat domain-containing protein [Deltaproteobacteria bacterium]
MPTLCEMLAEIDLSQVAFSATVDPNVQDLGWVAGIADKLEAAERYASIVIVAESQKDVPSKYLAETATLSAFQAKTFHKAVEHLYQESVPRRIVLDYERGGSAEFALPDRNLDMAQYQELLLRRKVQRKLPLGKEQPSNPHDDYEVWTVRQLFSNFRAAAKGVESKVKPSDVPRCVVLGEPGSGKSTLMQYLTFQAIRDHAAHTSPFLSRLWLPISLRLPDLELWAKGHPDLHLSAYLAERYKDKAGARAPDVEQWRRWLLRGEVLLLLDGLDGLTGNPREFLEKLRQTLAGFSLCAVVLTCRTISFDQYRQLWVDFPVFILAPFDTKQQDTLISAYFAHDSTQSAKLVEQLRLIPSLRSLAANPLLLSLICFVVGENTEPPATRGKLYEYVLEKLLTMIRHNAPVSWPNNVVPTLPTKLSVLGTVAWRLFAPNLQQLPFNADTVDEAVEYALVAKGYDSDRPIWKTTFLKDFDNCGLLRYGYTQYSFSFHLSVYEFLTARALADIVKTQGWDARIDLPGIVETAQTLIDKKIWDPAWQEIIIFLAGFLTEPRRLQKLLQLLADERHDDIFRHRLTLAALCLSEIPEEQVKDKEIVSLIDSITERLVSLWLKHDKEDTTAAVAHVAQAFLALGAKNGKKVKEPLIEWLCQRLQSTNEEDRAGAANILGHLGEGLAVHGNALDALGTALEKDNSLLVKVRAIEALRRAGAALTNRATAVEGLNKLASEGSDALLRWRAARALLENGTLAETDEKFARYKRLVGEAEQERMEPERERPNAGAARKVMSLSEIYAADYLRNKSLQGPIIASLRQQQDQIAQNSKALRIAIDIAQYGDTGGVRSQAVELLRQLGAREDLCGQILPVLVARLHDNNSGVRAQVAKALGEIGSDISDNRETVSELLDALDDKSFAVRYRAAEAVAQLQQSGIRFFLSRKWRGRRVQTEKIELLSSSGERWIAKGLRRSVRDLKAFWQQLSRFLPT